MGGRRTFWQKKVEGGGRDQVDGEVWLSWILDFDSGVHSHFGVLAHCPYGRRRALQHFDAVLFAEDTAVDEVVPITGH